jgi:hypothetical protein
MFPDTGSDIHPLCGAPLISMMQSSNLGSGVDTAVLWLVHGSGHWRIFGQC